jgi:uncharacterized protein
MHYLVTGHDHPGELGRRRRAAAREEHLAHLGSVDGARPLFGAAMLDEDGQMVGSVLVMDAEDRAALQAWLDVEPYVVADVWAEVTVQPCQVAQGFLAQTRKPEDPSES